MTKATLKRGFGEGEVEGVVVESANFDNPEHEDYQTYIFWPHNERVALVVNKSLVALAA